MAPHDDFSAVEIFDTDDVPAREWCRMVLGSAIVQGAEALAIVWDALPAEEMDAFFAQYDQVFGVWRDPRATAGFFALSIKGEDSTAKPLRMNAVPCVDMQAALRLQARYGNAADVASNSPIWDAPAPVPN